MVSPPTGTLTFLFTDIEGSTKMWERDSSVMQVALARHDEILRSAIQERGATSSRMETFGAVKSALTCAGFIPDSSRRAKVGIPDKRCATDSVVVRKEEPM